METKDQGKLQWHPAFFAGLQIELAEEAEKLVFENEHQLGTKPKEIDILIIKKNSNERIQKNIGRIFRTHNIVEYKSPEDYLSIDDFYKVYGYACFYKSDVQKVDSIKVEEITISFVCKNYPRKMMEHLQQVHRYTVMPGDAGIYYIEGNLIPIQLILTSELSRESNFWLRNLTNDIDKKEDVEELFQEYGKNKKSNLHKSVMNIIVRANREVFRRDKDMCEALMELMQDELEASKQEGIQIGEDRKLQELIGKKLAKGKSIEEIADELEESTETIRELMAEL